MEPSANTESNARSGPRKSLDLVLLGASGFTGRQAVRALLQQAPDARWAVAGRNADKLKRTVDELVFATARPPEIIVADATDAAALRALARQTRVLFNLAGPYHATGDAVVAACIDAGTHYLDLTGETFWIQRLVREQHDAAVQAGVKIMPCAGYEALPFDLANLWAAQQLRQASGEACRTLKIIVSFTGRRITRLQDTISGGTAATMTEVLAHDRSDCLSNVGCLLPPNTPDAAGMARRSALRWLPRYDDDLQCVVAPTLPGPFINPPVVLRSVAQLADASLFAADFAYQEGTHMGSLLPAMPFTPRPAALALQWAAAGSLSLPLANMSAAVSGPLQFQREALRKLMLQLAPKSGAGPSEAALDGSGWDFDVFATGSAGARFHGRVVAQGHPGYRSTPQMAVCVALGLAKGALGRTPHVGIVGPAAGLGIEAVETLQAAGVQFSAAA